MSGPCDWPVSYAGCSNCGPIEQMPVEEKTIFEQMATEYLWRWTEQQFGLCELTVRPCRQDYQGSTFFGGAPSYLPGSSAPWSPALVNGRWYNVGCGCGDSCGCDSPTTISLPAPVSEVVSVVIDGVVLDSSAYRVDNSKWLVRLDGEGWPLWNDMSSPSGSGTGAEGTWEVTYLRGSEVPVGGQIAAGILASEFAKSACGKDCALPKRLQSITRQGVSIGVLDTFDDIEVGHTGIWLVDSWVASIRKAPRKSRVASPDLRPMRRTTWQN